MPRQPKPKPEVNRNPSASSKTWAAGPWAERSPPIPWQVASLEGAWITLRTIYKERFASLSKLRKISLICY